MTSIPALQLRAEPYNTPQPAGGEAKQERLWKYHSNNRQLREYQTTLLQPKVGEPAQEESSYC